LTLCAEELDVPGEVLGHNLVMHIIGNGHRSVARRSRLCKANLNDRGGGGKVALDVSVMKKSTRNARPRYSPGNERDDEP
jgi:hypothetical protein